MSYNEPIIALESIIVDKVVTVPTARNKKRDTSVERRLERQCRKMERMRAKRETKGSWTSLYRPSTSGLRQGSGLE